MFAGFYHGRRILVTGHTGFKGGWLSLWLESLGSDVHGFSLYELDRPSFHETLPRTLFASETEGDVRALKALKATLSTVNPDLIFHLAAQPLVRASYDDPVETVTANTLGTVMVLQALRETHCPASIVVVTTDKCYENRNLNRGYHETDPLGGHDPYSASKAAAEVLTHAWRRSFFEADSSLGCVATARGGNVIGGGDYAADRIVPDLVRARLNETALEIRNPSSTRPWQHVFDCLSGYLALGARLVSEPDNRDLRSAFNFGPDTRSNRTVRELVDQAAKTWPGDVSYPEQDGQPHEATLLNLCSDKAAQILDWVPVWSFEESVNKTIQWYRKRHEGNASEIAAFSMQQIEEYGARARVRNLTWAIEE